MPVMKEQIRLCGKVFEIRRNPVRKHIAVGMDSSGCWFVGAPDFYSTERLTNILSEAGGMERLVAKVEKRLEAVPPPRIFAEGETLLFRGDSFPLKWDDSPGAQPVELRGDVLYIAADRRGKEVGTLEFWYQRQLYYILQEILPDWTRKLGAAPRKVSVKTVKTLWGSCSSQKSITFSTRLALVPRRLLEYVIAHELVHLKHMNHSPEFWLELKKHIPDCEERNAELKRDNLKYRWW